MKDLKHKIIGYIVGLLMLFSGFRIMNIMIDSKKDPERKAEVEVSKLVTIFTALPKNIPVKIPVSGKVESFNRIEIFSEVSGTVLKGSKDFKDGTAFKKGEIILSVDSKDFEATLVAQRSTFLTSIIQILPDLKLDYPDDYSKWEQYVNTFNINAATPELPVTDNPKAKRFISVRNIENQFHNIKSQEVKLSKYVIRAPFDGILTAESIQYGSIIRPAQKLGELIEQNRFEFSAAINVKEVVHISVGDSVTLTSKDLSKTWKGKVSRISKNINPATQSLTVYVSLMHSDVNDGMFLSGFIKGKNIPNSIEIPRKLINPDNSIYVVEDSKLKKIFPKIEKLGENAVILSAVEANAQILSENFVGAYENMPVQVASQNAVKE